MFYKLLITILVALLSWSCSSDEPIVHKSEKTSCHPSSRYLSPEEACDVASQTLKGLGLDSHSRTQKEAYAYLYNPKVLSRNGDNDTLFYVVNFNGGGFALILADRKAYVNTIAISGTGNFEKNDNPNMQLYTATSLIDSLKWKPGNGNSPFNPQPGPTNPWMIDPDGYQVGYIDTTYTYENFLDVAWGQMYPYNNYCDSLRPIDIDYTVQLGIRHLYRDRGVVGCAPVAVGQICSYNKKPTEIDGRQLDWEGITSFYSIWGLYDYDDRDDIAYLLARIGKKMGVTHGIGTSATEKQITTGLSKLGYSKVSVSSKVETCFDALKDGQVALILGCDDNNKGHVWVIDGYKHFNRQHIRFEKGSSTVYHVYNTENIYYFSFNWGYESNDHVYCLVGSPYKPGGTDANGNEIAYTKSFRYITNIK